EDRICDGRGERVCRIAHADAELVTRFAIDRVESGAPLGYHPQLLRLRENFAREAIVAADRAVDVADHRQQLVLVQTFIDLRREHLAAGVGEGDAEAIEHRLHVRSGNDDLHAASASTDRAVCRYSASAMRKSDSSSMSIASVRSISNIIGVRPMRLRQDSS